MKRGSNKHSLTLSSLEQTLDYGLHLGRTMDKGDIITLSGDLGAGKTTLTQAIGRGLQVPEDYYITSPTFSLIHEYPGRLPMYHLDLYRLSHIEEIEELGLEEIMYGEGVTIIEWPDRLAEVMPVDYLDIALTLLDENSRLATITAHGTFKEKIESFLF